MRGGKYTVTELMPLSTAMAKLWMVGTLGSSESTLTIITDARYF